MTTASDPGPIQATDWKVVGVTAVLTGVVVTAFFVGLAHAGKPGKRKR